MCLYLSCAKDVQFGTWNFWASNENSSNFSISIQSGMPYIGVDIRQLYDFLNLNEKSGLLREASLVLVRLMYL